MSTLAPWTRRIVVFAISLVLAFLVSSLTYWVARHPSTTMRRMRVWFSLLALYALLLFFWAVFGRDNLWPVVLFIGAIACASSLQTLIEGALERESLETKYRFARAFFTYLSTAFLLYSAVAVIAVAVRLSHALSIPLWLLGLSVESYGYLAGWLFTPLVISFYRFFFQSLHMRPGIDRPLRADELAP